MKRTVLFFLLVTCAIAMVSAQNWGPHHYQQGRDFFRIPRAESVSVSGNLTIVQGMIAVNSGGITYLTGGLHRFIGFIDGLKEGASVTLEGYAYPIPQNESLKYLQVQKMNLNGKDYDLSLPLQNARPGSDRRSAGSPPDPRFQRWPQHQHRGWGR